MENCTVKAIELITMAKIEDCDTYPQKGQQCESSKSTYVCNSKIFHLIGSSI